MELGAGFAHKGRIVGLRQSSDAGISHAGKGQRALLLDSCCKPRVARSHIGQTLSEAGKKRLSGDTARQATPGEVVSLKREARDLKEVLAETLLENRLLKKSMIGHGGDEE